MQSKSLIDWSNAWISLMKSPGEYKEVIEQWQEPIQPCWKRKFWKVELGYRKNSEKDRGEQKHERALLGRKGCIGFKTIALRGGQYPFLGIYSDMRLASDFRERKARGQFIADAFGITYIGGRWHPLAVEVKDTNQNVWYAIVENLRQIRMLRANETNMNAFLSEIGLDKANGAWGMVLAPRKYYERCKRDGNKSWECSIKLLSELKKKNARICLAITDNLDDGKIEVIEGNWSVQG
ncbi:MAG: hypothetical protein V1809_00105 [Planctomycetota bacterium]